MKVRVVTGGRTVNSTNTSDGDVSVSLTLSLQIMAANEYRKSFTVSNTGTVKIYLKLGEAATSSSWQYILPGGGSDKDGLGATINIEGYVGKVTISAAYTSTAARLAYTEFA